MQRSLCAGSGMEVCGNRLWRRSVCPEDPGTKSVPGVSDGRGDGTVLTQHTLACLTRQGAENLAQKMMGGGSARAERVMVNMLEGKMFAEFRRSRGRRWRDG